MLETLSRQALVRHADAGAPGHVLRVPHDGREPGSRVDSGDTAFWTEHIEVTLTVVEPHADVVAEVRAASTADVARIASFPDPESPERNARFSV